MNLFEENTQVRRTPGRLAGDIFQQYVIATVIFPVLFIFLTTNKIAWLTNGNIHAAVDYVDVVWPVFGAQYREIERLSGTELAGNYFFFFLAMLASYVLFVFYTLCTFHKNSSDVLSPTRMDFGGVLLCLLGGFYAAFSDLPQPNPKPFYDFYVDSFGLFYLRQWFLLLAGGVGPLILVVIGLSASRDLLKRRAER